MLNTTTKKNTNATSAANLSEAENNIMPAAVGKTITPSQKANTYNGAADGNGVQPVKLAQPSNQSPLIVDMYAAQRQANLDALEREYNAAISEIDRQKAAIPAQYDAASRQAAGTNALEKRSMNEMFTANGLSSGAKAQGNIAQSNALQRELGAIELAEAQALAELEAERGRLRAQYQTSVREAIMNNEMQKAAALYEEAVRHDEAVVRRALEQAQLDKEVASMRKASTGGGSYTAPKEPIIGRDPQSANMYISYSDGMTKMLLDSEHSMLTDTNEYCFHEIFPGLGAPDISAEYKTISYRRAGDFPTLGLVSMSGSVTGRTRANTFLITDDLVKNKEEARSPERLEKLYSDYTATLTTRMIGDKVRQLMLGTRWSAYDPLGRMEAEHGDDPRYCFIAIPVWDENEVSNFEYDHPDRYTSEKIRDIKATIDSADFECLFMQHGVEKEGLAFAADKLKYYNGVLPDGEPDNIVFVNDIAWGGGDSLSMPIGYVYGADVFVHDWIFDKRDKSFTKPRVIAKILQHKIKMGQMEANNGGDEYCDDVHRILRQEHGYSINMSHKKAPTNMSKLTRIEQHAPTIRNFYFRDSSCRDEDYRKAMNELTSFSFTAKNLHDDAADSMAMLAAYVFDRSKIATVARRPF